MTPKDSIKLGPGKVYFGAPEGYQPLPELYEAEVIEAEEETPWPKENPCIIRAGDASITGTIYSPELAALLSSYLTPMVKLVARLISAAVEMLESYPNQRVVHLALHAKKRRTRKKNMKRIARYYKNKR